MILLSHSALLCLASAAGSILLSNDYHLIDSIIIMLPSVRSVAVRGARTLPLVRAIHTSAPLAAAVPASSSSSASSFPSTSTRRLEPPAFQPPPQRSPYVPIWDDMEYKDWEIPPKDDETSSAWVVPVTIGVMTVWGVWFNYTADQREKRPWKL